MINLKGFYEEKWSAKRRTVFGMDEELSFWNDPQGLKSPKGKEGNGR